MPARITETDDITLDNLVDRGWLSANFGELSKASVAKQVTVGGVSGWCAGYVFSKVGRVAALTLGGGLLLVQVLNYRAKKNQPLIAHHKGIIEINWNKVNKTVNNAKEQVTKDADRMMPHLIDEVSQFARENAILASGFAGGFLIGLAS